MSTVTTWLEGRAQTVPADDPRLAEQERVRRLTMHVANMRPMDKPRRREYLVNVERREGQDARLALEDAFWAAWMAERGAPE